MAVPSLKPDRRVCQRILERVAKENGASAPEVCLSRADKFARMRWKIWRQIIDETGCSQNGLAAIWGVDNATIIHGLRALKEVA